MASVLQTASGLASMHSFCISVRAKKISHSWPILCSSLVTCCSVQPAKACASPMRFNCSTTASGRGLGDGGRLPLVGATTNDASKISNHLPAPAAARAAAEKTLARRPPRRPQSRHACVRRGAARGKRRSCYSTIATDAPNRRARRRTNNCPSNTCASDATFP